MWMGWEVGTEGEGAHLPRISALWHHSPIGRATFHTHGHGSVNLGVRIVRVSCMFTFPLCWVFSWAYFDRFRGTFRRWALVPIPFHTLINFVSFRKNCFRDVSLYSLPNKHLLQLTNDTLIVCGYQGDQSLAVIRVKSILSVVAMIPFPHFISTRFMVEKIGLDVIDTDHRGDDDEE